MPYQARSERKTLVYVSTLQSLAPRPLRWVSPQDGSVWSLDYRAWRNRVKRGMAYVVACEMVHIWKANVSGLELRGQLGDGLLVLDSIE